MQKGEEEAEREKQHSAGRKRKDRKKKGDIAYSQVKFSQKRHPSSYKLVISVKLWTSMACNQIKFVQVRCMLLFIFSASKINKKFVRVHTYSCLNIY